MRKWIDFAYENYPILHSKVTKKQLESLLILNKDTIAVEYDNCGKLEAIALYYKLSDKTFEELKKGEEVYRTEKDGKNIHFILLVSKDMKAILRGLRKVIKKEDAKNISWYSFNRDKLHTYTIKE